MLVSSADFEISPPRADQSKGMKMADLLGPALHETYNTVVIEKNSHFQASSWPYPHLLELADCDRVAPLCLSSHRSCSWVRA